MGVQRYAHGPTRQRERWSLHRFVNNFNTPMLVIHSELDYRVPFTKVCNCSLRYSVKAYRFQMLMFPDEGHRTQATELATLVSHGA